MAFESSENSIMSLTLCQGFKKTPIEISEFATIMDLHIMIERLLHIKRNAQKLIFKGKLLNEVDIPLTSYGLKSGSNIMVLGKPTFPEPEDEITMEKLLSAHKTVEDVEEEVNGICRKMESIPHGSSRTEENLHNLKNGFKNLNICNEKLMRLLETVDSIEVRADCEQARWKRKAVVKSAQKLMDQIDAECNKYRKYSK